MEKLAINGGIPTINYKLKKYNSIGKEEKKSVIKVLETGNLSQFVGSWCDDFFGGPKVKEFENICKEKFKVKHAISVNSWTSGLICAIGAIEINPGDEVILSPWTMSACSSAILHWGAIPVFADIESETFNIDIKSIEKNITNKTKAILAIDIFGHSCDIDSINKIALKHNLKVITDSAQAPGSLNNERITGTLADIGGFSLNYHKHIHTGEGGILVTNNDNLARRMMLIRNHAESVVKGVGEENITNLIGYNFRLGEIEAAIGIEQIKKLDRIIEHKTKIALLLKEKLKGLKGLNLPTIKRNNTHSFYIFPMILDDKIIKVSRKEIIQALNAEGVEGLMNGYVNLHLLPTFQNKIAYGSDGFPWSYEKSRQNISYLKGICPIAEKLNDFTFLGFEICLYELDENDIEKIAAAFKKVWKNLIF